MADTAAVQEAPPAAAPEAAAPNTAAREAQESTPAAAPADQASPAAETPANAPEASAQGRTSVDVHPARLPEEEEQTVSAGGGQVDILLNTTMAVTASLGQVTIQVRNLLSLGAGSVIKLDRRVGEPIDLFLRGVKFATGQLVVVGENLGVRIKDILPSGVAEGTVGSS
jgi:flagellar motor switch protein FliN